MKDGTMEATETTSPTSRKHERLLKRREALLTKFEKATHGNQRRRMLAAHRELQHVAECLTILNGRKPRSGAPRFIISSLFLAQCLRDLTADANEQFFFITGAEVDGVGVLDQKVEFDHDRRTMLGVTSNPSATHRLLIRLEQFGHRLLAHFHSHPGLGLASTHPSGTDEAFQRRLETAGYPTIAAIFSRDGYVRFFRLSSAFELTVHGEGVEDLGHHTYRISGADARR
jgi:hypothetical protein